MPAEKKSNLAQDFEKLLNVGIALSSIHELDKLLDLILKEARRLTRADAGTLYLVRDNQLVFKISQCDSLCRRLGEKGMRQMYESFSLPISSESVAGYVALNKKILNIPDVQQIPPEAPFHYNPSWDEKTGYITRSMMVVPMLNREKKVAGVLQLINALSSGNGGKIIPFPPQQEKLVSSLASQAVVAIENAELTESLKQAHLDTIFRLGMAAEYRDKETANHLKRMSYYSALIARELGWSAEKVDMIFWSSLMHDVGKVGIPDGILQKPGPLNSEERRLMEYHTIIGANILKDSEAAVLKQSRIIALAHHEKYDGTGYPRRIKGTEIPIEGRITILADIFDALSSKRVYKEALEEKEVLKILQEGRGSFFDPQILDIFLAHFTEVREIKNRYQDHEADFDQFHNLDRLIIEDG